MKENVWNSSEKTAQNDMIPGYSNYLAAINKHIFFEVS